MTFEKLSNNLNVLMDELNLNANELARQTGIPASSIKKIRTNNNPNPTLTTLLPLAKHFSVTMSQLIGDDPLPNRTENIEATPIHKISTIRVISWAELIDWPNLSKAHNDFIATERVYSQNSFAIRIEEDIEQFSKGTILLIEPDLPPQQNDLVLVNKSGQKNVSIKQVLIEDNDIFLKSIIIDQHIHRKNHEYKILGIIMEHRKYFR